MRIKDIMRYRALVRATYRFDVSLVRSELAAGFPPNAPRGQLGRLVCPVTALAASCTVGAIEIAEALLAAGADVTDDRSGPTIEAAICGRGQGKPELVKLLLAHGARSSDGVRSAAFRGEIDLLSQLSAAGADLRLAVAPPVNAYRIPPRTLTFLQEHGIPLPSEALDRLADEGR